MYHHISDLKISYKVSLSSLMSYKNKCLKMPWMSRRNLQGRRRRGMVHSQGGMFPLYLGKYQVKIDIQQLPQGIGLSQEILIIVNMGLWRAQTQMCVAHPSIHRKINLISRSTHMMQWKSVLETITPALERMMTWKHSHASKRRSASQPNRSCKQGRTDLRSKVHVNQSDRKVRR